MLRDRDKRVPLLASNGCSFSPTGSAQSSPHSDANNNNKHSDSSTSAKQAATFIKSPPKSSNPRSTPPQSPKGGPSNGTCSGTAPPPLAPPYLALHNACLPSTGSNGSYSSIGVASPPSPRCYDIIEEEMIFPMSDITEEDEESFHNNNNNKYENNRYGNLSKKLPKSQPIGIIPTIVTEDVDSDTKVSTSNESSWKSDKERSPLNKQSSQSDSDKGEGDSPPTSSSAKTSSRHSSIHCSSSPPQANCPTSNGSGSMADTHLCHYHTVHGNSIGQGHYHCTPDSGTNSPNYAPYKQRSRSNSGPVPGFSLQVRHSALISGGMVTLGASRITRRQSDDSETTSSSLRSRISPSGSSFFDSFRPRSTSDSKGKRPSVIAAIKNNFRRVSNSTGSNGSSSHGSRNLSPSINCNSPVTNCGSSAAGTVVTASNGSNSGSSSCSSSCNSNSGHSHNPSQHPNHQHAHSGHNAHTSHHNQPSQQQQYPPTNNGSNSLAIDCQSHHSNGVGLSHSHYPASVASAPISPCAVLDPFSLDYLYARSSHSVDCPHHPSHHHSHQHHSNHHSSSSSSHPQNYNNQPAPSQPSHRPRSRSGSSGPSSTMSRVLDIFRVRSNSIATGEPACCIRSTISHQDSICERIEYDDIDENLVYVRFFKFYRSYDIIPISAKLVVFDTQLAVKKAFFALLSNGVRAAPLWDSNRHEFIGMLTITDFINILRTYYNSTQLKMEELEEHKLDNWRSMLSEKARKLVSISPDESLFNAIEMLIHNKVHRLPAIDPETGNVLYILTHKRILKFLFLYYYTRLPMPSYLMKPLRELPVIGTYDNIITTTPNTPLIQVLNILIEKRVSALPVVDKKNKVVDIYAKFDVIHLAADKMYQNLDITVKKALEYRNQSEGVVKCTLNDTLHGVLEKIVQAEVHRIVVVDSDDHVIGIISLSDLLNFLVLRPLGLERNGTSAIKCSKVLEETAEEVLSDSHSSSNSCTTDMLQQASSLLSDANQLTTSSIDSSSDSSIASSKLILTASGATPKRGTPHLTPSSKHSNNNTLTNNIQPLIAPL